MIKDLNNFVSYFFKFEIKENLVKSSWKLYTGNTVFWILVPVFLWSVKPRRTFTLRFHKCDLSVKVHLTLPYHNMLHRYIVISQRKQIRNISRYITK